MTRKRVKTETQTFVNICGNTLFWEMEPEVVRQCTKLFS